MLKFFFPREEDFFQLLQQITTVLVGISDEFLILIQRLPNIHPHLKIIHGFESEADKLVLMTLEKLHHTFLAPFDRNDIHRFVMQVNDVIEAIYATAARIDIYQLKTVPKEIQTLAELLAQSAHIIASTTKNLENIKDTKKILEQCQAVNQLGTEAEKCFLSGMGTLFQEEQDLRLLLKIKEIYEYTQSIVNGNETIANIIKDIVLEYS